MKELGKLVVLVCPSLFMATEIEVCKNDWVIFLLRGGLHH